ncbi:hypothetical protein LPICM17_280113 [Lactococcus piscium]|nr:hypothetical protein LPICM17_280113 [Lactococcus piscium]
MRLSSKKRNEVIENVIELYIISGKSEIKDATRYHLGIYFPDDSVYFFCISFFIR